MDEGWLKVVAGLLASVFTLLVGGYVKLWRQHDRHHERLVALEGQHRERLQRMDDLTNTVEDNRISLDNKMESVRTEVRGDIKDLRDLIIRKG
jgi:uncharacterized protein YlxW (UPF0749 family)